VSRGSDTSLGGGLMAGQSTGPPAARRGRTKPARGEVHGRRHRRPNSCGLGTDGTVACRDSLTVSPPGDALVRGVNDRWPVVAQLVGTFRCARPACCQLPCRVECPPTCLRSPITGWKARAHWIMRHIAGGIRRRDPRQIPSGRKKSTFRRRIVTGPLSRETKARISRTAATG